MRRFTQPVHLPGTLVRAYTVLICGFAVAVPAFGEYALKEFKIAGGGESHTTGPYSLSGTIGQHEAAEIRTKGPYTLVSGFWNDIILVQTEGAPQLLMSPDGGGQFILSWDDTDPDWILQQSPDMESGNWSNAPSGNSTPVNVPSPTIRTFYRLYKP